MNLPSKIKFRSGYEREVYKNTYKVSKPSSFSLAYEDKKEKMKYTIEHEYLSDLVLTSKDKLRKIHVECKGYFKPSDRKKMLAVIRDNPDKDIRMLFQQDNKLSKAPRSKKYSQWCEQHGIKWAVGNKVPDEWIKELK